MVGCRYNAKNTLDKNYLYLAENLGVTIFPETKATLIRENPDGGYKIDTTRSTALFNRKRRTFQTEKIVLAAGVLGTVPLLLTCQSQGTLTRLSPMLGSRVRTNSETLMGVTSRNDDVDYSKGIAITSSIYPDEVTHVEPVRYSAGSDLMSFLATVFTESRYPLLRPFKWLFNIIRHPVTFLQTFGRLVGPNDPLFSWSCKPSTIALKYIKNADGGGRLKCRCFHRRNIKGKERQYIFPRRMW